MTEDLSAPKELEDLSDKIWSQDSISKKDFVELCVLAADLIDKNWDQRMGIAYIVCGMWGPNEILSEDNLLDEIGSLASELELPDGHIADVKGYWGKFKKLTQQAKKQHL